MWLFLKSLCCICVTDFQLFFFFSGTNLVKKAIYAMVEGDCDEVSC